MNGWKDLKTLPKEVWILCATTLVNRAGTMVLPFLVIYLTKSLQFSASKAGTVLAVYGLAAFLSAPLSGRLSDRIGPLRQMKASLFLSALLLVLFPFVQRYEAILILTFFWSVVTEAFRPANMAVTTDLVAPEQRKAAFALLRLAVNLGMSVGPAAAGFLARRSFHIIFLVDAVTSAAAAVLLMIAFRNFRLPEKTSTRKLAAKREHALDFSILLADKRFVLFLLGFIPVAMVFFQSEGAMALFLVKDLHFKESTYGMLFALNTLIIVAVEVPLNMAVSHWPHRASLILGSMLYGIGFGALVLVTEIFGAAATVVIWTFGEMILMPAAAALVADISPEDRRGEYMGFFTMTFGFAFAIGPWLGTEVYARFGAPALWYGCFVAGAASAIMLWRSEKSAEHRQGTMNDER